MKKSRIILYIFLMLGFFLIVLSIQSYATDIIVDSGGHGDYTKIQDAINASNDGDTIYIWNGTYTGDIEINRTGLNIIGNATNSVIINLDGGYYWDTYNVSVNISYLTFINATDDAFTPWDYCNISYCNFTDSDDSADDGLILIYNRNNVTVSHCNFNNNTGRSIGISGAVTYSHNITIDNCTFNDIEYAIYIEENTDAATIKNCEITTCNINGVRIDDSTGINILNTSINNCGDDGIYIYTCNDITIDNNVINDVGVDDNGIFLDNTNNVIISFNNISNCDNSGIFNNYCDNVYTYNNTISNTGFAINYNYGENGSITGNYILNSSTSGIILFPYDNVNIENNIIVNTDQTGINIVGGDNITISFNIIQNVTGVGYGRGIKCSEGGGQSNFTDLLISNNVVNNADYNSIRVTYCVLGIIKNNFFNNSDLGMYSRYNSNLLVYNNYFDNTINIQSLNEDISWNITKTLGTNIIGGPYLGGNYWSDYTGIDANNDGIGDTYYNISSAYATPGIDYLPLTVSYLNVYVYNESNCSQPIMFDILISNRSGTQTYESLNNWGGANIPITSMPYGDDVIVLISSSNKTYNFRIYYIDIDPSENFSLIAYLPPRYTEGGPLDVTIQSFEDTALVSDPDVNLVIQTSYDIYNVFRVEVYNETLYDTYGGWVILPANYFTFNSTQITVNAAALNNNSTMVKVTYYYKHYPTTADSFLYYFNVVSEEITYGISPPINSAKVTLKTYINCTDSFETISTIYTDGNGECSVYLVPGRLYKIFINKSGYYNETDDYVPDYTFYGSQHPKVFKIVHIPTSWDEMGTIYHDALSLSKYNSSTMKIYYINRANNNSYVNFTVYDYFNDSILIYYNISSYPNNVSILFNFSSYNLTGDIIKVKATAYRADGSIHILSKFFSVSQGSGGAGSAAIAAILSVGICLFGLTLAHPKRVLGVVGIIVMLIALAITAFADQSFWYLHLVQAVELILLIFIILIFREEGIHAV